MRSLGLGTAVVLCSVVLAVMAPASHATARPVAAGAEGGRLVLLLDSSGSMKEAAAGGGTKIEAAKAALGDVVDQLPDTAQVGIRVFGATVFSHQDTGACTDTQSVVPVVPLDRTRLRTAVARYEPYGETPIGHALEGAAKDLGKARAGERRTIVLLSDGEPTCAPDPCVVARRLRRQGVDLRINVVGLDVSGRARSALQCVAAAGGGRYFDAASAQELSESLVQVSVRALRLFSLTGSPIQGGTSTADPTALEPGDYLDETLPAEAPRFYRVDKPEGGSVSVSALARPGENPTALNSLAVTLLTTDGIRCASDTGNGINALGLTSIVGAAASYSPLRSRPGSDPCAAADHLLAQVDFNGSPTAFGLQVRSRPRITDVDSLPPAVDSSAHDTWERPVALAGSGTPVVGGASFAGAPELVPGTTYADTLRPREQLIYKVKVGYGQSTRMTARLESDPRAARLQDVLGLQVQGQAFNALGQQLGIVSNTRTGVLPLGRYDGEKPVTITEAYPPVRVRNVESPDVRINQHTIDGYYYLTLEMGGETDRTAEDFQAPVRLAVAVDGQVQGAPAYADEGKGATASTTRPPAGDESAANREGGNVAYLVPWVPVAVGGGVLLVLLVAGALLLGARAGRRS